MSAVEEKVLFITGASRGLGFEMAKAALDNGHKVVAAVRKPEELEKKLGTDPNFLIVEFDIRYPAPAGVIRKTIEAFGRLDVLINNVGQGLTGAIEEISDEERIALYETNVFGPLRLIRAALPVMRQQHSGHIINISSVGGFSAGPGSGDYCATKAALERASEALSKEVAPLGIRVTVVAPGGFRTEFAGEASMQISRNEIADYAETVGQQRKNKFSGSGKEPSDPKLFGPAIVDLFGITYPPFLLALGPDSVAVMKNTAQSRLQAAEENFTPAIDILRAQESRNAEEPEILTP